MSKAFEKLVQLLKKLFQTDQADLDFGIYRIMNQRREEINRFLEEDLLTQVKEALSTYQSADQSMLQADLQEAIQKADDLGVDPNSTSKVKEIQEKLATYDTNIDDVENQVYNDLYQFFRRYYDDGDFISQRRYKDGVYAIPYEGEEVKLYWANYDQYYIKTSEYLRDYTFKLPSGKKAHFKLVEADTEKDNRKESDEKKRVFILAEDAIRVENGEMQIGFEFHPDEKKRTQKQLNEITTQAIFDMRASINDPNAKDTLAELATPSPTESDKNRTLLAKHLEDYTRRNTQDYFIHKDLGKFLRRELDFYIKNEIMGLDDIEEASAPRIEQYLSRVKVLRLIAHKIIDFLAQIEDFQKKLWLKKKFVVETNYCITLDRIPEELYLEIAANEAQREEWVRLFAINEIKPTNGNLLEKGNPGYSEPLTVEFLKTNPFLVIDTKFFDEEFKNELLNSIEGLDENLNGLLVLSENYQALNLMNNKFNKKVKCIYIDPPYNTEQDKKEGKFIYKDSFEKSSWVALMNDRIYKSYMMLKDDGLFFCSIDHNEIVSLKYILELLFMGENFEGLITWRRRHNQPNDKTKMIGMVAEYILCYAKNSVTYRNVGVGKLDLTGSFSNPDDDPRGDWASKPWKVGSNQSGTQYKIITPSGKEYDEEWMGDEKTYKKLLLDGRIYFPKNNEGLPRKKYYKFEREKEGQCATNWWHHQQFGHNQGANDSMTDLFGYKNAFSNPKPTELISGILQVSNTKNDYILDFFAGSGTTGHAIITLNRDDKYNRKYILVEMGEYFGTVLKPRIQKVIYSEDWKNGKPLSRKGSSHTFKYLKLESYEDTLNNLQLKRNKDQNESLFREEAFKEDYMLHYMLDVEARNSLLDLQVFETPFDYHLNIANSTVGETIPTKVDLMETFNYLIGLWVKRIRYVSDCVLVQGTSEQDGRVLVIWRDLRKTDNKKLESLFCEWKIVEREDAPEVIYVNGDNTLMMLRKEEQSWRVKLTEEEFHRRMFEDLD